MSVIEQQKLEQLLPESLKSALEHLPRDKTVSLLTRHSIREQPENYNAHYKLPLTPEGIQLARYWGSLQKHSRFNLFSSPVGRCIETAASMQEAKQLVEGSELQTIALLAEPGCFIDSREQMTQVGHVFVQDGPIAFMNRILQGSFPEIEHPKRGVKKLLEHIRKNQGQDHDVLNVHVSHDTVLAAFIYTLLEKTEIEESEWPKMMEGVYLWFDADRVQGIWRGRLFERPLSAFFEFE